MLRFKALDFNWFILKKVQDMVNKIDDGSGVLDFEDFVTVIFFSYIYDSMPDLGEIEVYQRADFQSGSRVLKKVF